MWDTRSWPSEVICLCDYNLFEVVCPFGIPAHDLLRSFVCAGYQLMTFWGRLSVQDIGLWPFWGRLSFWNTSSWPSEVICLCGISDYNLFEVVCPCGITAYDLLRSFVCAGYRITVFLWSFCPFGIPAYDLLRSFGCVGYQLMTFWGHLSVQNTGLRPFWGRLSFWNTSSWPFEVVCLCGIPDYNLFEVVCPFENTSSWPFEVVCLWGISDYDLFRSFVCAEFQIMTFWGRLITAYDLLEVICLCRISDYDLFEVVWEYQLMTLRSFVCAEHWIYDLLRSFVCVVYCIDDLWGHLFLRNHWIVTFLRSFVYVWIYLLLRRIIHPCV